MTPARFPPRLSTRPGHRPAHREAPRGAPRDTLSNRPRVALRLLTRATAVLAAIGLGLLGPPAANGAPGSPGWPESALRGEWPLRPAPDVLTPFDPPAAPWRAGHRGVDLAAAAGQPVRAAAAGVVTFAGRLAGRGVLVISHGDTRTTYEPVRADLAVGATVRTGEPVGTVEAAGGHCRPRSCLHWGWLRGDTYLDPLLLVTDAPVRLLPLWSRRVEIPIRVVPRPDLARPALRLVTALPPMAVLTPLSPLARAPAHRGRRGQARGWAWR